MIMRANSEPATFKASPLEGGLEGAYKLNKHE